MIVPLKYSAFLTEENRAGTDLTISVPSDTVGGIIPVTVTEGDAIADIQLDPDTSAVTVKWLTVVDGSDWIENQVLTPGDILITVGTGVEYQKGLAGVILEDGTVGTLNMPIMFEIAGI